MFKKTKLLKKIPVEMKTMVSLFLNSLIEMHGIELIII